MAWNYDLLPMLNKRENLKVIHLGCGIGELLDISAYAKILFEQQAKEITIYEKIYPHILADANAIFEWNLVQQ